MIALDCSCRSSWRQYADYTQSVSTTLFWNRLVITVMPASIWTRLVIRMIPFVANEYRCVAELDMRYRQDTIVFQRNADRRTGRRDESAQIECIYLVLVCVLLVAGVVVVVWYMRKKRKLSSAFLPANQLGFTWRTVSRISPFHFNVLGTWNQPATIGRGERNLMSLEVSSSEPRTDREVECILARWMDFVYIHRIGVAWEEFIATVTVEDGLDATHRDSFSMIVQILVGNAIKHGLAGKDGGTMVYVSRETNGT